MKSKCMYIVGPYPIQQVLSHDMESARTSILVRYATFFKNLRNSTSKEVAILVKSLSRDIRTPMGYYLIAVEKASGHSLWFTSKVILRDSISAKETLPVLAEDQWRIPMLDRLLNCRQEMNDLEKWGRYPNYLILSIHLNQYDDLFRKLTIILAQKLTRLEHFKRNI